MKKYEYRHTDNPTELNNLGHQGWEAYAVSPFHIWLKREIPEPQKPDYSNASIAKANELLTEAQRTQAIPSKPARKFTAYWYDGDGREGPEFKWDRNSTGYGWRFNKGTTFEEACALVEAAEPDTFNFAPYPKPEAKTGGLFNGPSTVTHEWDGKQVSEEEYIRLQAEARNVKPVDRYICQGCHKTSPYFHTFDGCPGPCSIEQIKK